MGDLTQYHRCVLVIILAILLIALAFSTSYTVESVVTGDLPFVTRSEWGAKLPTAQHEKLTILPPVYAIIIHTATPFCSNQDECMERVRGIQEYHMTELDFSDIGYNFLIGGDGSIYEGRGWDVSGTHTFGYNSCSLGIAFIGHYSYDKPTQGQINATLSLLEYSVAQGKLAKDYKLLAQRQAVAIASPGKNLYEKLKSWKNWSSVGGPPCRK